MGGPARQREHGLEGGWQALSCFGEDTGLVVAEVPCGVLGREPGESKKALKVRVRPHSLKGLRLGLGYAAVI